MTAATVAGRAAAGRARNAAAAAAAGAAATNTQPADAPAAPPRPSFPSPRRPHQLAGNAAGFILGLTLWGWVIMPLLTGGPSRVKQVLLAKFVNKTPDRTWLP